MASAAAMKAWEICLNQGAGFLRALASEGVKESSAGRAVVRAICISASITWWKYSVSGLAGQEGYIHRIGGKSTEDLKKRALRTPFRAPAAQPSFESNGCLCFDLLR